MTRRKTLAARVLLAAVIAVGLSHSSVRDAVAVDEEAQEIAFRAEFGLSTDLSLVRALRSDPAARTDQYPIPLTPEERAEMDRRIAMQHDLAAVQDYSGRLPESFGGLYIDQAAGGVLDLAFTADAEIHAALLTPLAPRGSQLRVHTVTNSLASLDATHAQILEDLRSLEADGIALPSIWTDIPGNRVAVGIEPFTPEFVELLNKRYGAEQIRVYAAAEGRTTACTGRDTCPGPPLRAGIRLNPYGCTSGWIADAFGTISIAILTAGHCLAPYAVNTLWTHSTLIVGPQKHHSWYWGTPADAGVIDFQSNEYVSNWMYRGPTSVDRVRYRQGYNGDVPGMYVCQSGRVGGIRCGTIKATNASPTLDGAKLVRQRYASYLVWSGDSGGPVFAPYAEYEIYAYGIQSGVLDNGNGVQELNLYEWSVYSHVWEVEQALGVRVYAICCP